MRKTLILIALASMIMSTYVERSESCSQSGHGKGRGKRHGLLQRNKAHKNRKGGMKSRSMSKSNNGKRRRGNSHGKEMRSKSKSNQGWRKDRNGHGKEMRNKSKSNQGHRGRKNNKSKGSSSESCSDNGRKWGRRGGVKSHRKFGLGMEN